ncbi:MAG: HAMP domain-containing protein, partial [Betaproteobacteria bacterium]
MSSLLKRLSTLATGRKFSSLSVGIVIAMCAGLLLPALIGGMALTNLRQEQMRKEMESHLADKIQLLANSLVDPVWNVDTRGAKTIADASLLDPQVVRITINDPSQIPFLNIERPERRLGTSRVARHELIRGEELVGKVEVETDDGLRQQELRQDRRAYFLVLLGQFLFSLILIMLAIRLWVLRPLARLADFSNQLASGDLDRPLDWEQPDEIGRMARQLDQMRKGLRTAFSEQEAILNNVQVGVLFLRERTIQLANRHAELIFGYPLGGMHGKSTKAIYISDEQYSTIGERAYSAIGAVSGRYEQELQLKRLDGSSFLAQMRGCALDPDAPQAG